MILRRVRISHIFVSADKNSIDFSTTLFYIRGDEIS